MSLFTAPVSDKTKKSDEKPIANGIRITNAPQVYHKTVGFNSNWTEAFVPSFKPATECCDCSFPNPQYYEVVSKSWFCTDCIHPPKCGKCTGLMTIRMNKSGRVWVCITCSLKRAREAILA